MPEAPAIPMKGRIADHQHEFTHHNLIDWTNQHIDWMRNLIQDLPDDFISFMPEDPNAHDQFAAVDADVEIAWTLGHNILHVTASSEESAARGSSLARGLVPKERSRYEPDWQTIAAVQQCMQRLEESRRMRLAFLDTWPDEPRLDLVLVYENERTAEYFGEPNAIGMTLSGLRHEATHFDQMLEIIRQASAALVD